MTDLSAAQRALQHYVLGGELQVRELIAAGPRDNAEQRLAVYHGAYRQRLLEALATDFVALSAVLGLDQFRAACLAYVEATPSRFRNVRWYGGRLPDFLATTAPWNVRAELAEIARFEWILTLAFDAEDAPCVTFADLAALPPDAWSELRLRFHPSLHTLPMRSNAPALRMAVDSGAQMAVLQLSQAPIEWAVWRGAGAVHFRSLGREEHWVLAAARSGEAFPQLCEGLAHIATADAAPALAAGFLKAWLGDGLVADIGTRGS
jgi:hypothetical protein